MKTVLLKNQMILLILSVTFQFLPQFAVSANGQESVSLRSHDSVSVSQFFVNSCSIDSDHSIQSVAQSDTQSGATSALQNFTPAKISPVSLYENMPQKDVAIQTHKGQKPLFALKTNLLYDLATIVNASLEVPIGNHWSIAGEFIFPWWYDEKRQNCLQVYNGNLEVKYWFRPRGDRDKGKFSTMTGWFLGVYGGAGIYDLEYKGEGFRGETTFSTGLMGGYAHSIGKSLRMEYSLGVGYMQTHYTSYSAKASAVDGQWDLYRHDSANFSWIGPTSVKVSLVWMINKNVKKGGIL